MKTHKKQKYTNLKIGKIKIINDFLPPPEDLIMKEETIKVTLSLSKSSVEYFKNLAQKKHTQYQKMIRILLDKYAAHYHR